jgi:hypothetical protein
MLLSIVPEADSILPRITWGKTRFEAIDGRMLEKSTILHSLLLA